MTFASPHAFWLLLVIPLVMIWHLRSRRTPHLVFSSTAIASRAGRSVRQRLMWIPFVLRLMVLMLFIIALARPREGTERVRDLSKGIAIEMVVDRSGSMKNTMNYKGERLSRLETVKRVFIEFVNGNMEVAEWEGRRWLRAGTPSDFEVPLPEVLPERFTVEFVYFSGANTTALTIYCADKANSDKQKRETRLL